MANSSLSDYKRRDARLAFYLPRSRLSGLPSAKHNSTRIIKNRKAEYGWDISRLPCGVVDTANGKPLRFVSLNSYDSSSLEPLEVFIKSKMTAVSSDMAGNSGRMIAGFREIPVVFAENMIL